MSRGSGSNCDLCVEYARSGRAKCRGDCRGTIEKGALRLGKTPRDVEYSDWVSTSWIHWDCLSNNDRGLVRRACPENINGFNDLRVEDQERVRESVKAAQKPKRPVLDLPPLPALPAVERKRKHEYDPTPSTSRGRSNISDAASLSSQPNPGGSQPNPGDAAEEEEDMEGGGGDEEKLYTTLATQVVGTKYYTGLVGLGEQVNLVREPTNRFDGNAIKVTNISNIQVGHLPKNVAAKLAPLLDGNRVTTEGTMRQSNIGWREHWALRIDVAIYAPSAHRTILEPYLLWATPGQRGFGEQQPLSGVPTIGIPGTSLSPKKGARAPKVDPSEVAKAAELRGILDGLHSADGRRTTLLDQLCGQDVLELPVYPSLLSKPSGLLNSDLLKHQLQALKWCIDAENPQLPNSPHDRPVQFWARQSSQGETYYYNIATKTPTQDTATLGRGGILGDDMGLGKTLTMLSLILATKDEDVEGVSKTTLIVCPPSVLSNWTSQIEEHIHPKAGLKVHVYHEGGRNVAASYLAKCDVVITTYQVVSAENPSTKKHAQTNDGDFSDEPQAKKRKTNRKGLYSIKFKRVILDEGHVIRNSKTKMAQGCRDLQAELRWVVTGTPIINSASDLSSLLSFLRVFKPLDDPEYFKRLLTRPLGRRDPAGVELLKALMSSLCLRRTKEMQDKNGQPLVPLPPVTVITVKVPLDPTTREFYDAVERESAARVNEFFLRGADLPNMPIGVNVLSMLTRLRQISLDKSLIPQNYLEDLCAAAKLHQQHSAASPAQELSPEEKKRLQSILDIAINDCEECPVCYDELKEPRITTCSHRFCLACITEVINRTAKCPMDRRALSIGDLVEPGPNIEGAPEATEDGGDGFAEEEATEAPPPKIEQLIRLLKLQLKGDKSLVFSQFTSYLRKIAHHLRAAGIPFIQFDGSMSARKRKQVIETFSKPLSDESDTEPDSDSDDEEDQKQNARGNSKGKGKAKVVLENPVVMLISLKSGSVGINLTAANNVFLMDPWWQESIENQAIDRTNRIGQKKPVSVFRIIAEGTVEEKVLEIQARKSDLINQAFSGTKRVENQKQKKEARLAELIELFSVKGVPIP